MKLNESKIIDYLDDRLGENESADVKAALQQHNTADVEDARLGMQALQSLGFEESVAVSENFWPRLREQLPERTPARTALSQIASVMSDLLWPSSSKWAISARVAVAVTVLAVASLWFGPQRTVTPSSAITPSEKAFISRSMQRHEDFVNTPPAVNTLPLPVGDAGSADQSNDSTDDVYIP